MRSKTAMLPDVTFGYVFVFLLGYVISVFSAEFSIGEEYATLMVFGSIVSTFFSYMDPVDMLVIRRKVFGTMRKDYEAEKMKLPRSLVEEAYRSSYIDNSRTRTKSGFYLIITFSLLLIGFSISFLL